MKKVLLTATVQSHIAQFHKPLINMLKENCYEVHVAAKDNLAEKNGLKIENADIIYNIPFSRSPKSRDNIKAYKQLKEIINKNNYEIIHCNTPMGGIITRLAAIHARKNGTKLYYTAHGFHFYKGAPLINWILYYPIEKFMARYTDKLITINHEDYEFAKKKIHTEIRYIHGVGVGKDRYNLKRSSEDYREKLGLSPEVFVIICTGELNNNKNQKEVIKAVAKINNEHVKVIFAGNGPNLETLETLAKSLKVESLVKFIGYVTNLEEYVKISDIAVSMSIREGLGLNVIEAMMCGIPVIASVNRGHKDLILDNKNGFLVNNFEELADKIELLYNDKDKRYNMGRCAVETAEKFSINNVKGDLKQIYGFN